MLDLPFALPLKVCIVRPSWLPCLRVGSRTPKVVRRAAGSPRRCVRVQGEKAMPDLPSPPPRTVVCCKAMLAALFAVKSRCSVVSMPWPCIEQRQGRQFVGEMGVKARHCQALFSCFISKLCVRPCWLPPLRMCSARLRLGEEGELLSVFQFYARKRP